MPETFEDHGRKWMDDLSGLQSEIDQYQQQLHQNAIDPAMAINQIAIRRFLIINFSIVGVTKTVMSYNGNPNRMVMKNNRPVLHTRSIIQPQNYLKLIYRALKTLNKIWYDNINPNQHVPTLVKLTSIKRILPLDNNTITNLLTLLINKKIKIAEITNRPRQTADKYLIQLKTRLRDPNYQRLAQMTNQDPNQQPILQIITWFTILRHCQNWLQKRLLRQFKTYDLSLLPPKVKTILKHDFSINIP